MRALTTLHHHGVIKSIFPADMTTVARNSISKEGAKLCRKNRMKEARDVFKVIRRQGIKVDIDTYHSLLQACIILKTVGHGEQIHAHVLKIGIEQNEALDTKLVIMYAKCGEMDEARIVFERMKEVDVLSWTALIGGYAKHGNCEESLRLFYHMRSLGIQGDNFVLPAVLNACAGVAALQEGMEIHGYIIRSGFNSDVFVVSALVDMYAKCGSLERARHVFDKMCKRNVVSWNAMIAGYARNGNADEALKLFHGIGLEGLKPNLISWSTVIAVTARNGFRVEAFTLFRQMQLRGVKPNSIVVTSVLPACYAGLASMQQGKEIHGWLIRSGFESDVFVGTTLVDMYAKCGDMNIACKVFDNLPEATLVPWNAMIAGYSQNGHGGEALKFFHEMQKWGFKPNVVTIASVLPAFANLAALVQVKEIHGYIIRNEFGSDVFVGSGLVDMYAKCSNIGGARCVFDRMSQRNLVSWNAMIVGYAMHGHSADALTLFYQMQETGMNPDEITFTGVLSACSHAGLVDEGWKYFDSMGQYYHIMPGIEHCACMVDLLGRAGHLNEAYGFINNMLSEPDACVWGALLSACRIHHSMAIGECVAEQLFELEPENAGNYVSLSNIYASAGRWDDVAKVRRMMKCKGFKTRPGCSWIEVNNRVHTFLVGDRSHPQTHTIYALLDSLTAEMIDTGYVPDTNFMLHDEDI